MQTASLQHYVLIHPSKQQVVRHARQVNGFPTRILSNGELTLAPLGITISIDDLYG